MSSVISGDQTWLMWMAIVVIAAACVFAEQKTKIGGKLSGAIIAIFATMILANIGVLPTVSETYKATNSYILPLSIPLLLFQCNLKKIIRESGRLFVVFHVAAIACMLGAVMTGFLFRGTENIGSILAMEVGAYVGGPVNLVAMSKVFELDSSYIGAGAVSGILLITILLLFLGTASNSKWVRKTYKHPHIKAFESTIDINQGSVSSQYWKPKNISLLGMGMSLATTFLICGVSSVISGWVLSMNPPMIVQQLFGSIFLLITAITVILVTLFPKFFEMLQGAEELGSFMIMMYFVTLGGCSNVIQLLKVSPVIVAASAIIGVVIVGALMIFCKLLNWNWEDLCTTACASIGGPTTAAAFSINKGWNNLIVPGILVGLYGYIIGNYFGILVGNLF